LVMMVGLPPSMAATAELVVPRSMPTTCAHIMWRQHRACHACRALGGKQTPPASHCVRRCHHLTRTARPQLPLQSPPPNCLPAPSRSECSWPAEKPRLPSCGLRCGPQRPHASSSSSSAWWLPWCVLYLRACGGSTMPYVCGAFVCVCFGCVYAAGAEGGASFCRAPQAAEPSSGDASE
jgi:hypothetical protein